MVSSRYNSKTCTKECAKVVKKAHDRQYYQANKATWVKRDREVRERAREQRSGLDRKHWSSAGPIRAIFKGAFAAAGLPYFNPHSFRKTLALLGGHICKSPEEYKAWSQNLGHENVLTTFSSYGDVARHRQAQIIRALGTSEQRAE